MTNIQIFVFGHSIVHGFYDTKGGWVQRLSTFLVKKILKNSKNYYEVFNLGIPDEDSRQLLERFEDELKRRHYGQGNTIIIFQFGANDIQYLVKEDKKRISIEEFKDNTKKLVTKAREYTNKILFVGEAYTTINGPIPGFTDIKVSDLELKKYSQVQKKVCEEMGISFIDLREKFTKKYWSKLLKDGFHPTSQGHDQIYKLVKEKLVAMKVI